MFTDSLSISASATGSQPKEFKEWNFGLEQLDGKPVVVLRASPSWPPVAINGWPENVRRIKPKLLNKTEQCILQDALRKGLVSMVSLKARTSEQQIGENFSEMQENRSVTLEELASSLL